MNKQRVKSTYLYNKIQDTLSTTGALPVLILDFRDRAEYAKQHICFAHHVQLDDKKLYKALSSGGFTSAKATWTFEDLHRNGCIHLDDEDSSLAQIYRSRNFQYVIGYTSTAPGAVRFSPGTATQQFFSSNDNGAVVEREQIVNMILQHIGSEKGCKARFMEEGFETFRQRYPFLCTQQLPMQINNESLFSYPSEILDQFLYVGDERHVNPEKLRNLNIKYILNVAAERDDELDANFFVYKKCPLYDDPSQQLLPILEECTAFINEAEANRQRILVYGVNGVSRPAAIVIGYLMAKRPMNFQKALAILRSHRFATRPNQGFVQQLQMLSRTYAGKGLDFKYFEPKGIQSVIVRPVGQESIQQQVGIPPTIEELMLAAGAKLDMPVARVFNSYGYDLMNTSSIKDGEIVYVSAGERWKDASFGQSVEWVMNDIKDLKVSLLDDGVDVDLFLGGYQVSHLGEYEALGLHARSEHNQDRCAAINPYIPQRPRTTFSAVFDGHGMSSIPRGFWPDSYLNDLGGGFVAQYAADHLPKYVKSFLAELVHNAGGSKNANRCQYPQLVAQALKAGIEEVNRDVRQLFIESSELAGASCAAMVLDSDLLTVANVGTTSAIIISRGNTSNNGSIRNNSFTYTPLSRVHSVNDPEEEQRMRQNNCVTGNNGTWGVTPDSLPFVNTRAIGDGPLTKFGLVCVPDIVQHRILPWRDLAVFACSGGFTTAMEDMKEVADIIGSYAEALRQCSSAEEMAAIRDKAGAAVTEACMLKFKAKQGSNGGSNVSFTIMFLSSAF